MISGSGANDRDETVCGQKPFRVIAEYLAIRGYAVLRLDDRGVGSSTGSASSQDFAGSVADVVHTCRWMADHPVVDKARMALLGHSEGGLIAAAAAPRTIASAVVMLAGPAMPMEQILHEQARMLSLEAGATSPQIAHERQMNERVFALARSDAGPDAVKLKIEAVIRRHLRSWPDLTPLTDAAVTENAKVMASVVGAPAYRSLLQQRPEQLLARVKQPILALYGSRDVQVPGVANAEACARICAGNPHGKVLLLPEHNHLLQKAVTGSIDEYETLPPGPSDDALGAVFEWLEAVNG